MSEPLSEKEWPVVRIPDLQAEIRRLQAELAEAKADRVVLQSVAQEIQVIMNIYREQEASIKGVGTPGGPNLMIFLCDVWKLLNKWDEAISAARKGGKPE